MTTVEIWPWVALLLLGAVHGVNPGMGWLFAVALGLQEKKGRAVWRALPPLALGHALAIGVAVGVAAVAGRAIPVGALKWVVAAVLLGFGAYRLVRHGHFRYGGMRVGLRDLTIWSFLMASAHGAGLMVLPIVLGHGFAPPAGATHVNAGHAANAGAAVLAGPPADATLALATAAVHTLGYLLVAGGLALLVYEKFGLRLLRASWINLDLVWALALIATALLTPLLG